MPNNNNYNRHHQHQTSDQHTPGPQGVRKRRRGMIEKRRRDKINNSLSELRRLVPAAFEKQGSAKLEKAEILQMTVDYLRMLHARGLADSLTHNKLVDQSVVESSLGTAFSHEAGDHISEEVAGRRQHSTSAVVTTDPLLTSTPSSQHTTTTMLNDNNNTHTNDINLSQHLSSDISPRLIAISRKPVVDEPASPSVNSSSNILTEPSQTRASSSLSSSYGQHSAYHQPQNHQQHLQQQHYQSHQHQHHHQQQHHQQHHQSAAVTSPTAELMAVHSLSRSAGSATNTSQLDPVTRSFVSSTTTTDTSISPHHGSSSGLLNLDHHSMVRYGHHHHAAAAAAINPYLAYHHQVGEHLATHRYHHHHHHSNNSGFSPVGSTDSLHSQTNYQHVIDYY